MTRHSAEVEPISQPTFADQYGEKGAQYFARARKEILPLIPHGVSRVLEIGCGSGETLLLLKESGLCDWVAGAELAPAAASRARDRLDLLIEGDIEQENWSIEPVDLILCLDVLEHLRDPWLALRKLHGFLSPGGTLIASIPNVRNFRVVMPLLVQGRWTYEQAGILDRTHLRFFTKQSAVELLECSGLEINRVETLVERGTRARKLNKWTFGVFEGFFAFQYLLRARKPRH